ncbi:MAG: M55 family metallopeptidase [Clostridia bacterium]|nr:M55 family metallopeptidase [Clostridia bacterium]
MNVYIMVDSEGVGGLYDRQQNVTGRLYASDSRDFMTRDVNICAEACKEAGVETVYVRDMHDDGSYIRWEKLSPAVDYIVKGAAAYRVRHAEIENCDVAILLGYHAMTGTEGAILSHTMDGGHHYYVNGEEYGEIAIDAALCGTPIILVTGDDKACAEAKRFLPWVTTCAVKEGLDFEKGLLLSPARAEALLREKTAEAIKNAAAAKVFTAPSPVSLLHTGPSCDDRVGEGETLYEALTNQKYVKKETAE